MNENVKQIYAAKLQRLKKALEDHQFAVSILETREDVIPFLKDHMAEGSSVGVGGSVTLDECGVIDWLRGNEAYRFIDRYRTEDKKQAFRDSLLADVYLTSTNAVTMDGNLYNVDGTGNRVAALIYGPDHVYVIAGVNKITEDVPSAVKRVEQYAAPANCVRLKRGNPCETQGECMHCNSSTTICNQFVTTRRSSVPQRIHIVLVKEELGF